MTTFILTVFAVLAIWAMCSLAEGAIYAVRMPYVRRLEESGHASGETLAEFKSNMDRPISAILIVNTIASAAGASVVGAQASALFGESNLWIFSLVFTIAALLFSEIAPKVLGVAYNRQAATWMARPLAFLVAALTPAIWLVATATRLLRPRTPAATAPEEEVQTWAEISAEEGSIMPYEADLVRNALNLDKVTAGEIMTPASVVTLLPDHLTVGEVARRDMKWSFSRIPVYDTNKPGHWTGFVLSRDVLAGMAKDQFDKTLSTLSRPLKFVSDTSPGHLLLRAFLQRRTHMFGVLSEDRKIVGIVTLEDVLESLIGAEIVDEFDPVVDMQELAKK